jgi:hypothetical protein
VSRKPAKTAQEPRTRPVGGITMRQALTDPELLGNVLAGDSWRAWRILLIAAMGEALTDEERPIFTRLTARAKEPGVRCLTLLVVAGSRCMTRSIRRRCRYSASGLITRFGGDKGDRAGRWIPEPLADRPRQRRAAEKPRSPIGDNRRRSFEPVGVNPSADRWQACAPPGGVRALRGDRGAVAAVGVG